VLSPTAGAAVPSGSTKTITWEAPANAEKYMLYYTKNNGAIWTAITPTFVTGTSYEWSVPALPGNKRNCKIQVVAYNMFSAMTGSAISNAPFTIEVVKVTSPNGGETLTGNSQTDITFTLNATAPSVTGLALSYSKDNGTTWTVIPNTEDVTPGDHTVPWTVPAVTAAKTACKVKVDLLNDAEAVVGSDMSNAVFTIQ